eukprot:TRINITY_DN38620_c0_g1_i1.p1 TRINITY_DN38620_c0_g1~~TRINITY_DN38620_c0_g1_i1.p1  ORF type:complete len:146 (+),score=25.29 TRINITY_DN38620_c0_g1_i1:37-474(+)
MEESSLLKKLGVNDKEMIFYENRLKSFKLWPFSSTDTCTPERMAAAGFYACGGSSEPDLARCFFCRKELDGWEPMDDPWEEHKKRGKQCGYVNLNKSPQQITIKEMISLESDRFAAIQMKIIEAHKDIILERSSEVKKDLNKLCT